MSSRIDVLNVNIDNCSAKEAVKAAVDFIETDPINVIELVTIDNLLQMKEYPEIKEKLSEFDYVLAGDKAILEAMEVEEHQHVQETEKGMFLKMFLKLLRRSHKRVFLIVESEEAEEEIKNYLTSYYKGIQIIETAILDENSRTDDMVVNAVNGEEIDCIISVLPSPLQEDFILKNRSLLNAHLWLGIGKGILKGDEKEPTLKRVVNFIIRQLFKKEIEKSKKNF